MRTRTKISIVAAIVLAFLALGSIVGVMALTQNGWMGNAGYGSGMMNGQYNQGGTMSGYQQNTGVQATPVTGMNRLDMKNFAYQYANMQVRVGTTLTWTNQDNVQHSVTFKNGMKESGLLSQGQAFSYLFNAPGTYQYFCDAHPYMVATITVVS